jgi:putative (di)nucleoside polyphosphate hydrolase
MSTRFFRAGVGTVIYNEAGEVALFKRATHPIGVWELQQGGIDVGEKPEDTLWRELKEEIGLTATDVSLVTKMPKLTAYNRPEALTDSSDRLLGQAHQWFFLKLKTGIEINLKAATEDEVSEFMWSDFEHIISITGDHKKHVYKTLQEFYIEHVLK